MAAKTTKQVKTRYNIDINAFKNLCGLQCTKAEMASFFGCSQYAIDKWCKETFDGKGYIDVWEEFSQVGKVSLRRMLWKLAEKDVRAALFLAKNYLALSDQPSQTYDNEAAESIKRLVEVIEGAATKYGAGVASSLVPEQEGAAGPEGETTDASPLLVNNDDDQEPQAIEPASQASEMLVFNKACEVAL